MSASLLYYSRMRFITGLLPLLTASKLPTGAHCISIFAGGLEDKKALYPDDLSLCDPKHYSNASVRSHVTYMTTLFFERLAQQHSGKLSCVHIFPSLVITPAMTRASNPWWFKIAWFLVRPIARFYCTPAHDIAEWILYLATDRYPARQASASLKDGSVAVATDGERGGGAYSVKHDGETNNLSEKYAGLGLSRESLAQKVCDHTMEAFEEVSAGRAFIG